MKHESSNIGITLFTNNYFGWLVTILFFSFPVPNKAQADGEATAKKLVKMGFENVRWSDNGQERIYVIENIAYRLNGVGISKAIEQIQQTGLPADKPCRLIVLDNNVPQISLYYKPVLADSLPKATAEDWKVSYDLGDSWNKVKKVKKINSSLYKVDILVYPELSFKNLIITQIYQVLFNLSPTIEVSLWPGMKLTAQMVIPIYNDGYSDLAGKVHPGFITLSQSFRLPYNIFATATIGHFNVERYGIDMRLFYPFKDERFSLEGRIGCTSVAYWDGFTCYFNTKKRITWSVGGNFYWPLFNTQFSLRAEQYLLGEKGVRFDMIRHFRYCSIGFYAMKAKHANSNGGFRFQVALPPYKYKRKKYYPRIEPSKNMGIAYNAGNERYYYKMYRATASDNIMQQNSFNPYFIKSELLNF